MYSKETSNLIVQILYKDFVLKKKNEENVINVTAFTKIAVLSHK